MRTVILLAFLSLASCRGLRAIQNEKLTIAVDSAMYFTNTEKNMVVASIQGKAYNMIFDTGSGATIFYSGNLTIEPSKLLAKTAIKNFNGEKVGYMQRFITDSLKTKSFAYQDKIVYSMPAPELACRSKSFDGLLSRPIAPAGYLTELNYETGYLKFIKDADVSQYQKLPARYSPYQGRFEIELEINGVKNFFLFDTGNSAGIFLDNRKFEMANPLEVLRFYSLMVGNQAVELETKLDLWPIKIGNILSSQYVGINTGNSHNNVGMKFITQFNWILDEHNDAIYCKPIDLTKVTADKKHSERPRITNAAVFDEKLLVAQMNYQDPDIEVGDEIISIAGEIVTVENQCEMARQFNQMPFDKSKVVLKRKIEN